MPKFNVTMTEVEAKTLTITVEANTTFDAVRVACLSAEMVPESDWSKDYDRSYSDFSTQMLDEA